MADYFDSASAGIDQQKRALLEAVAQQGSLAKQAYDQAQAQQAQMRQQAISGMLGGSGAAGMPSALAQQLQAQIGDAYDRRTADLASASAGHQAAFGQQSAAGGTYMDEANAAIPALRSQLAERVATMQADAGTQIRQAQQAAQDRALQRELGQMQLERARLGLEQDKLAASRGGSAQGVDDILKNAFGGLEGFGDLVTHATEARRQNAIGIMGSGGGMPNPLGASFLLDEVNATPDRVGDAAGLPSGMGQSLYDRYLSDRAADQRRQTVEDQKQARQDALDSGNPTVIHADPKYREAVSKFLEGVDKMDEHLTESDIVNNLIATYGPEIAQQVMSEYGSVLNHKRDSLPFQP